MPVREELRRNLEKRKRQLVFPRQTKNQKKDCGSLKTVIELMLIKEN